jgi:hypothetical protein
VVGGGGCDVEAVVVVVVTWWWCSHCSSVRPFVVRSFVRLRSFIRLSLSVVIGCPLSFVRRGSPHSSWVVPLRSSLVARSQPPPVSRRSIVSPCYPPCEQWLAGMVAGAGGVVSGGISVVGALL